MSEYVKQAKDFLVSCDATMKIKYLGKEINKIWNENEYRNTYRATITTPYGSMWVKFWDSIYDTHQGNLPTEYDILACLQKYDVGSLEDFISEYGYDPEFHNVKQIYNAVCNEYKKICRCFTEEQIQAMCEIY